MFDYALVDETVRRIAEKFSPDRIYVFGSVARREAVDQSDLDLIVVMDSDEPSFRRSIKIRVAVADIRVPKDRLVLTPDEFREEMGNKYSFVYKAVNSGVLAYGEA